MARTEVSNFRVEFEILLKRIRVEDAEAHQKMMRMKYEPKNYIIHCILLVQTAKTIINYHVKFEDVQITW